MENVLRIKSSSKNNWQKRISKYIHNYESFVWKLLGWFFFVRLLFLYLLYFLLLSLWLYFSLWMSSNRFWKYCLFPSFISSSFVSIFVFVLFISLNNPFVQSHLLKWSLKLLRMLFSFCNSILFIPSVPYFCLLLPLTFLTSFLLFLASFAWEIICKSPMITCTNANE